ncbi:hypothetical protein [Crossiella sp. CA198]|uniref:hypothetical protein n=1 Tax=Crossiella sp. CA198 TaxID=3455607 RepID=UPI003F8D190A
MFRLDPKTVERLARTICDLDGPYERRGRELETLLAHAGWRNPPDYDGSPRVPWLTEELNARAGDRGEVERLLCRVCDPLEYEGGAESAAAVRQEINRVLAPERLVVSHTDGRPVLGELLPDRAVPVYVRTSELEGRLLRLIEDRESVDLLVSRAAEAKICESNGAYVMALIGIGSFVEGVLFSVLTERDEEIRELGFANGHNGKRIPAERAPLQRLIDVAHEKGWIQMDAKEFAHKVRDYRNFVHPRAQIDKGLVPDRDTLMMCWAPVQAVLNDLEAALLPR